MLVLMVGLIWVDKHPDSSKGKTIWWPASSSRVQETETGLSDITLKLWIWDRAAKVCACLQKLGWEFEISAKCAASVSCLRVWWNRKTLGFLKSQ